MYGGNCCHVIVKLISCFSLKLAATKSPRVPFKHGRTWCLFWARTSGSLASTGQLKSCAACIQRQHYQSWLFL